MKISKLFHWLYAILMFLPIMVFIPNAFYYGFNEQAVAQEKTEQVPVYYESNIVNANADIVVNKIYKWKNNYTVDPSVTQYRTMMYLNYCSAGAYTGIQIGPNSLSLTGNGSMSILNYQIYFVPSAIYYSMLPSNFYEYVEYTDYKVETGNYVPLTTNMSITDSMSYAWDSVWQNDLFSWSYGSFLTQPFLYITNLFNVPATNTLLYCLSYWLNISIIWLTFDLVMYIPLLVHRWLDKGVIE